MNQFAQAAAQADADFAQRVGVRQLAEQHRDQLGPAAKAFGAPFGIVFFDQRSELGSGEMLEQLIEQTGNLYDWIALLLGIWRRISPPGKRTDSASINYRRAFCFQPDD
jgi:hypothetical protein